MCKDEAEEVEDWIKEFMDMPKEEWEKFVEEMEEAINSEKRTSSPKKPKTAKPASNTNKES